MGWEMDILFVIRAINFLLWIIQKCLVVLSFIAKVTQFVPFWVFLIAWFWISDVLTSFFMLGATSIYLFIYRLIHELRCNTLFHISHCNWFILQGKRGIEKQPFQLPDFIAATGIEKIRQVLLNFPIRAFLFFIFIFFILFGLQKERKVAEY